MSSSLSTGYKIFILCAFSSIVIIHGQQAPQNNEQMICNEFNVKRLRWTCKPTSNCRQLQNISGIFNELRCGSNKVEDKICCPESIKTSITSTTTPTREPTSKEGSRNKIKSTPASPSQKNYTSILHRKCTEYAGARYHEYCTSVGFDLNCQKVLDCVKTSTLVKNEIRNADGKEFPHMALLGYVHGEFMKWVCDGSLISERFILSAAHCTGEGSKRQVRRAFLGEIYRLATISSKDEHNHEIVTTYNHPQYRRPKFNHDIALHKLKDAIKFNQYMRPICLHTEPRIPHNTLYKTIITDNQDSEDFVPDTLSKTTTSILSDDVCTQHYANERSLEEGFEAKNMICAEDPNSDCSTSFDGPMQIEWKEVCMYALVGIPMLNNVFCDSHDPIIYTRVSAYLNWIVETVWPNEA